MVNGVGPTLCKCAHSLQGDVLAWYRKCRATPIRQTLLDWTHLPTCVTVLKQQLPATPVASPGSVLSVNLKVWRGNSTFLVVMTAPLILVIYPLGPLKNFGEVRRIPLKRRLIITVLLQTLKKSLGTRMLLRVLPGNCLIRRCSLQLKQLIVLLTKGSLFAQLSRQLLSNVPNLLNELMFVPVASACLGLNLTKEQCFNPFGLTLSLRKK